MDRARLDELAGEFEIVDTYADAERMLAETKPDVLCFVCLPQTRLALIELGVRHGVKAIAYEKPMAANWPEAKAIHAAVTSAGVKTILSHQHKYGGHWQKAREFVAAGEVGEVREVRASAKGWMLHYASHLMDYSMFLAGRDRVAWVTGHIHGRGKLEDNHPSPDFMLARYAFEDGVPGLMECGTCSPSLPGNNSFWMNAGVTVYGSEGHVQVVSGSGVWARKKSSSEAVHLADAYDPSYDQPLYFEELADSLDDEGRIHSCNGDRCFHGFEVIMGACLSALDNRRVDLPFEGDDDILMRMRDELPDCGPLPAHAEERP